MPANAAIVPGPLADFQAQLAAYSMRAPGHVGIAVQDVATGLSTGINASAEMPAASTIKIPVMVEVFRQLVGGRFDLNTRVRLQAADKDWGYGDLSGARVGSSYPVSRLLSLMIDVSDNTATNMLIRLVGRGNINAEMADLGLAHTRLTDSIRSSGPIRWALRSSPNDMAHLLGAMAKNDLIDEWSSREMIAILRGQRHNGLLPQPLPRGTTIAHKTGTLHDTLNDVGIVYVGEEPYVIAVMTTDLPTLDSGRRFIRGVSRMAYDALGRFASWREENGFVGVPESERAAPAIPDPVLTSPDARMWTPQQAQPAAAPQPAGAPPQNGPAPAPSGEPQPEG
ncbi:MAG: beta-lactamase class [Candidatus Eremiobacteraeota bacterium]|jgi:beta-lactamase class A|nr:beta-lactamase class [Candidatus Eremiobacteraeota bacterium]